MKDFAYCLSRGNRCIVGAVFEVNKEIPFQVRTRRGAPLLSKNLDLLSRLAGHKFGICMRVPGRIYALQQGRILEQKVPPLGPKSVIDHHSHSKSVYGFDAARELRNRSRQGGPT